MPLRFRILQGQPLLAASRTAENAVQPADATGWGAAPAIERLVEMSDLEEIRIGRRGGLDLTLPFPTVSALHTVIRRAGSSAAGTNERRWLIEDKGSTNGSWVGHERLQAGTPRPLLPGQTFRVGEVAILFDGWVDEAKSSEGTASLARRLVADLFSVLSGGEIPKLVVESGAPGLAPLIFVEREKPYLVGRAETCALRLALESVSREHAAFVRRWDGIWVRDLGSTNGVRVKGRGIAGETHLEDGDSIAIGDVSLRLDDPEDRYLRKMESSEGVSLDELPGGRPAGARVTGAMPTPFPERENEAPFSRRPGGVGFGTPMPSAHRRTSGPRRAVAWGEPSRNTTVLSWILGIVVAASLVGALWMLFLR